MCVCALRRSSIRQGERSAATTGLRDAPIVQTVDIEVAFVLDAGCGLPAIQVSWGLGGLSYRWSMLIPMIPSCWFQAIAMTAMIHFKEQPSQKKSSESFRQINKLTIWHHQPINTNHYPQFLPLTSWASSPGLTPFHCSHRSPWTSPWNRNAKISKRPGIGIEAEMTKAFNTGMFEI